LWKSLINSFHMPWWWKGVTIGLGIGAMALRGVVKLYGRLSQPLDVYDNVDIGLPHNHGVGPFTRRDSWVNRLGFWYKYKAMVYKELSIHLVTRNISATITDQRLTSMLHQSAEFMREKYPQFEVDYRVVTDSVIYASGQIAVARGRMLTHTGAKPSAYATVTSR
jgi:hypothetical protein